jgi:hypothetical protein
MSVKYDIYFILTYKVNQDFLENLFAILRLNGGTHDHPSPLQALNRLRLAILGKNLQQHLKRNQNTENVSMEESFLLENLFRMKKTDYEYNEEIIEQIENDEGNATTEVSKNRTLEEVDGMEYANGFIARSLLADFPTLANKTRAVQDPLEDGMYKENYVQDLSHGGLMQPTDSWNNMATQMDTCFNDMHNIIGMASETPEEIGFRNTSNVEKRTIKKLKTNFPDIPDKIVRTYTTKRINIRIKHMQKRLQERKIHKHKIANRISKKQGPSGYQTERERDPIIGKNIQKLKHLH